MFTHQHQPTPHLSPIGPPVPPTSPANGQQQVVMNHQPLNYSFCQVEPLNTSQYSNASNVPQIVYGHGESYTGSGYSLVPSAQYVQQQYTSPHRPVFANSSSNVSFDTSMSMSRVPSAMDMNNLDQSMQMMALDISTGSMVPISGAGIQQIQQPQPVYQYHMQPQPAAAMGYQTYYSAPAPYTTMYNQPAMIPQEVYSTMPAASMQSAPQLTYAMPAAQNMPVMINAPSVLEQKKSVCHKLHQFNLSRWRPTSVRNIIGDIACFVTDAHGSKYVQEQLRTGNRSVVNLVYSEVVQFFNEVCCDQYGNFVVQKLIEVCERKDRVYIAECIINSMVDFCHHRYACRVVQKLIKASDANLDYSLKVRMLDAVQPYVVACSEDQSANHVVQCFMEAMKPHDLARMVDNFCFKIREMSSTKYGCRVLQKALRDFDEPLKTQLLDCVKNNLSFLMMDEFGNYVVQEAVRIANFHHKSAMFYAGIKEHVIDLSQDKHASNVLERFIEGCEVSLVNAMAIEILYAPKRFEDDRPGLCVLLSDMYGNYVVQKLMQHADENMRQMLIKDSLKFTQDIQHFPYGKQIIARLDTYATGRTHRLSTSSNRG